ncbi:MAG TPA: hypothetical protein PKW63_14065 [Vicinamibacterales bacterium]|nr:hypothetical protein [Vicinamibacterales bacterium]
MKTAHFPLVVEEESNGTMSAYVVGVPGVYASADSARSAIAGVRRALVAHLELLERVGEPLPTRQAQVRVLKVTGGRRTSRPAVTTVGLGALLGRKTSRAKAAAARANGLRGGRPPGSRRTGPTSGDR